VNSSNGDAPASLIWRSRKLILYGFVLVALVLAAAAFSAVRHQSPWNVAIQAAIPDPQALFQKTFIRVLVVGLDYDYDAKDQETSARSRSDVIMAIKVDFANKRVAEVSVPRDMVTTLPNGQRAKINQAQSDGGIDEAEFVVADWLGIPSFDRYVILRIDTMKDLINAIGGIDAQVETAGCLRYHTGCSNGSIDYDDSWGHLHVHLREGLQHLDGETAVGYARFRHDWCSDPCRIMRQQQVVKAILQRVQSDRLGTLLHINSLLGVVDKDVQTNFTPQEQLSIAFSLRGLTPSHVATAQVPYTTEVDLPGYGSSIVADERAKRRLVRSLLLGPGEKQRETP
jgi:polyisoprenyl-teichoic acid--peptidoglycan teichoic acid transferase